MLLQKENQCFTLTFHCSNIQNNSHPKLNETTRNKEKKINIRVQQNCRTNVTDETKTKIDLKCQ